jgi:hypothetical protein
MNVVTLLTSFGEIICQARDNPASDSTSRNFTKPLLIVPVMTEHGPALSFRPVMVSSKVDVLTIPTSMILLQEDNPPKKLVDEYLQATSGIILTN